MSYQQQQPSQPGVSTGQALQTHQQQQQQQQGMAMPGQQGGAAVPGGGGGVEGGAPVQTMTQQQQQQQARVVNRTNPTPGMEIFIVVYDFTYNVADNFCDFRGQPAVPKIFTYMYRSLGLHVHTCVPTPFLLGVGSGIEIGAHSSSMHH